MKRATRTPVRVPEGDADGWKIVYLNHGVTTTYRHTRREAAQAIRELRRAGHKVLSPAEAERMRETHLHEHGWSEREQEQARRWGS